VFKDSDGDPVSIPKETWEWCSNPTAGCSYIDNNTYSNFQSVQYKVWEDDAPGNPSDECGSVSYSWTSKTTSRETSLSNGFHGTLYTSLSRESSYYTGLIDELEVYRYALDSEAVRNAFASHHVLYLVGDWTNGDETLTRVLRSFDRPGVPLYLLYLPGRDSPLILPQLLTPKLIVAALNGRS